MNRIIICKIVGIVGGAIGAIVFCAILQCLRHRRFEKRFNAILLTSNKIKKELERREKELKGLKK